MPRLGITGLMVRNTTVTLGLNVAICFEILAVILDHPGHKSKANPSINRCTVQSCSSHVQC